MNHFRSVAIEQLLLQLLSNTPPCLGKMPWPSWAFWRHDPPDPPSDDPKHERPAAPPRTKSTSWDTTLNKTDWSHYTTFQTIAISSVTTATTFALYLLYKKYVRRVPNAASIKPDSFHKASYYGFVTRVGDGDGFHFFHTPGGRLMGWGWAPGRRTADIMKRGAKATNKQTMSVRMAGIDAPEMAHFGRPEQPWAKEALEWLKGSIGGRYVRVRPLKQDQYQRVVGLVERWRWGVWRQDVGLVMLRRGLATVYEAKIGSEVGGTEGVYRKAEERAKRGRVGMWRDAGMVAWLLGRKGAVETPRAYKTRMVEGEKVAKNAPSADMAK